MGLFDKMKETALKAAQSTAAIAGDAASGLWSKHGDKVVDGIMSSLTKAVSLGAANIADEAKYKTSVIDASWDLMPLPVKLLGRERLQWDQFFAMARSELIVVDGETVTLHPDARTKISDAIASRLSTDNRG